MLCYVMWIGIWVRVMRTCWSCVQQCFSKNLQCVLVWKCQTVAVLLLLSPCIYPVYPWRNCYFGRKCCVVVNWFCAYWQSVMMPVSFLWQQNSILNLMTLFALVLRVSLLRTVFGFIFLNYHSHYYVFFVSCRVFYRVCFIFIVHAAFVSIKPII